MNDTIEKLGILAIRVKSQLRPLVVQKIGRISKKRKSGSSTISWLYCC